MYFFIYNDMLHIRKFNEATASKATASKVGLSKKYDYEVIDTDKNSFFNTASRIDISDKAKNTIMDRLSIYRIDSNIKMSIALFKIMK